MRTKINKDNSMTVEKLYHIYEDENHIYAREYYHEPKAISLPDDGYRLQVASDFIRQMNRKLEKAMIEKLTTQEIQMMIDTLQEALDERK